MRFCELRFAVKCGLISSFVLTASPVQFSLILSILIQIREDPVRHPLAVGVPGQSILRSAMFFVTSLSMNQQHSEIHNVEIRHNMGESTRQRPCETHEKVPEVIGMTDQSPPSGHQEALSGCRSNSF